MAAYRKIFPAERLQKPFFSSLLKARFKEHLINAVGCAEMAA